MMETEEKYKVVIVDDERTAIDALRRELEPLNRISYFMGKRFWKCQ